MYADKDWNYGIDLSDTNVEYYETNNSGYVWDMDNTRSYITINAYQIPSFKEVRKRKVNTSTNEFEQVTDTLKGNFRFTPNIKAYSKGYENKTTITLYPYGLSKLRLTIFPLIKK